MKQHDTNLHSTFSQVNGGSTCIKGIGTNHLCLLVDLNEEFSAISGRLLLDQAEYLNDVVQHILAIYQHRFTSVVIVGHSMGGIVARLMPTLANYQPHSINTILTLASPHAKAPIVLDPKIARIYQSAIHPIAPNITIMSLAGGTSDSIVNSDAASLASDPGGLTAFTTSIPQVWTTCDHMAILWCNQLVKRVAKALVEITNKNDISGTRPFDDRIQIFQKYFAPPSTTPVLKGKGKMTWVKGITFNMLATTRICQRARCIYCE